MAGSAWISEEVTLDEKQAAMHSAGLISLGGLTQQMQRQHVHGAREAWEPPLPGYLSCLSQGQPTWAPPNPINH